MEIMEWEICEWKYMMICEWEYDTEVKALLICKMKMWIKEVKALLMLWNGNYWMRNMWMEIYDDMWMRIWYRSESTSHM